MFVFVVVYAHNQWFFFSTVFVSLFPSLSHLLLLEAGVIFVLTNFPIIFVQHEILQSDKNGCRQSKNIDCLHSCAKRRLRCSIQYICEIERFSLAKICFVTIETLHFSCQYKPDLGLYVILMTQAL